MLKTSLRLSSLFLLVALVLGACGYHNPYTYSGPEKSIYVTHWKNKTNALQLDTKIYQSLTRWFQKTNSIKVTKEKAGADLILAGEILSIQQPSLSYGAGNTATQVQVVLTVRYILKDIKTDTVLIEVPSETWSEDARTTRSATATADNESRALASIVDDLSEKIYIKSLNKLSEMQTAKPL
jgi:outer membrane lipopolysaccharide assembly protein LptE/RlpB